MKDFKTLLLLSACAAILFLSVYFLNVITQKDHSYAQLSDFTADMQIKEDFYSFNFEISNKMTGLKAPDVSYTVNRNDKKEQYLSGLVREKPLLIYRYADVNCNTCYEAELEALQREFAGHPDLAGILCSYAVDQEFVVFKKINKIKLPLYRIPSDAFTWDVEHYGNPYYFVLHTDMKISHVYVPNKIYPEFNRQYLEGVKRFLSE
jgi:hypothetical protein